MFCIYIYSASILMRAGMTWSVVKASLCLVAVIQGVNCAKNEGKCLH